MVQKVMKGKKECYKLKSGSRFTSDNERQEKSNYLYRWISEFVKTHYNVLSKFQEKRYKEALTDIEDDFDEEKADKLKNISKLKKSFTKGSKEYKDPIYDLRNFIDATYNESIPTYGLYPYLGKTLKEYDEKIGRPKLMNQFAQYLVKQKYRG